VGEILCEKQSKRSCVMDLDRRTGLSGFNERLDRRLLSCTIFFFIPFLIVFEFLKRLSLDLVRIYGNIDSRRVCTCMHLNRWHVGRCTHRLQMRMRMGRCSRPLDYGKKCRVERSALIACIVCFQMTRMPTSRGAR
jgi:hypothetical protein